MTFDVVKVGSEDFPDIEAYRDAVKICLGKAQAQKKEKDIGFFEQALESLREPEIRILRIADFNTKGVPGPCIEGQPFHTLAKADGVTDKDEIDSGGSFGIGKNAVFALSDIQTAFFSTLHRDASGDDRALCIGKTLFVSHKGADGEEKRRKGYWGKTDGFMPLDEPSDIPAWLRRDKMGTSIFSICMRRNPVDWRYEMTAALLMNFFAAIERNEMEFEIDEGAIKINQNTIQELFGDPKVSDAVDALSLRAPFEHARKLHSVLIDTATELHTLNVPDLGEVHLRMLVRDGLGYSVEIVRNGMYITHSLENFKAAFKRFPLHQDFAVLIEPAGKTEGEWFKRLEGPKHNDLSAERITKPELRARGQKAFEALGAQIRKTIQEVAKSTPSDTLELDELNDLFASEQTRVEDENGLEQDPRTFEPTVISPVPVSQTPKVKRRSGRSDKPRPYGPGSGPGSGPGTQPGTIPSGPGSKTASPEVAISLEQVRTSLPDGAAPRKRRLHFTAPKSGQASVILEATGLSSPDALRIVSCSDGRVDDGCLVIDLAENNRMSVIVELETDYIGPVELSAVLHSKEAGASK